MSFGPDYETKYEWGDCFCQGGNNGIVLASGNLSKVLNSDDPLQTLSKASAEPESYRTAFFEAFPKKPSCFIRGEGENIEEAETNCWNKYQKILLCTHEMERRNRTDGYGYCKHCSYSSSVFEPLTKCCKCKIPTAYTTDFRNKWYCKKHSKTKPKNPNPSSFDYTRERRIPRKYKKLLKRCAKNKFSEEGILGKIKFKYYAGKNFICNNREISMLFKRQEINFIKKYKVL